MVSASLARESLASLRCLAERPGARQSAQRQSWRARNPCRTPGVNGLRPRLIFGPSKGVLPMAAADIRKEMPPVKLSSEEFERRYRERFADPAYARLKRELDAVTAAAWDAYSHSRKSPA